MIPRHAKETALRLARGFPILAITGPRQSGKTTLARMLFADRPYVTLEDPDQRELALTDPRGFLARFPDGAVIDEAQHEIDLLFEMGGRLQGIEIKSGATLVRDWLKGLAKWQTLAGEQALPGWLIYGGDEAYSREGIKVFDWRSLDEAAQQN